MRRPLGPSLLVLALVTSACAGDPPSSRFGETPSGPGPRVVYDPSAKPLPNIPLPNDTALHVDARTATGKALNVSKYAKTYLEQDLRAKADRLDGFGTFQPISVSFDAPLDLKNIVNRHTKNDDPADDALYLVDVDPASPERGQRKPIDAGSGNFPIGIEKRRNYFENDERWFSSNLLLETTDEDVNKNGKLDPGEDTDFDGVLDRPNYIDPAATPESFLPSGFELDKPLCSSNDLVGRDVIAYDNLATFWEEETNTLLVRPLMPLRPGTKYAVVLTNRLVGRDGNPVRSPFAGKSHASQDATLAPLVDALPGLGLAMSDVAFAWTFTTGTVTRELEWIRAGLYGHGKMAYLGSEFPVEDFYLAPATTDPKSTYYGTIDEFNAIFPIIAELLLGGSAATKEAIISDVQSLGGLVIGQFDAPNFLADRDGLATAAQPADDDESFDIDPATGASFHGRTRVTYWCFLPKRKPEHGKEPFKTVLYIHGYGSSRIEALEFAGRTARFGMAMCALDAYGHGLIVPDGAIDFGGQKLTYGELLDTLIGQLSKLGPFAQAVKDTRARDLDNDGTPDPGGDFWTADLFHTRDIVRQTAVEHMQFIRMLRSFDGKRVWPYDTNGDGRPDLAGDVDGDGIVDLGGDGDRYSVWGRSLGGILSGVLAGIEPALTAAAPTSGGAGLLDIGIRSRQGGVPEAVFLPLLGPFVVGNPNASGRAVELKFLVNNVASQSHHPFGSVDDVRPGDRVEVKNHVNGEVSFAIVPTDKRFRIPFPADALGVAERRPLLGLDRPGVKAPVVASDTTAFGDRLTLTFSRGKEPPYATVETFQQDVTFMGTVYAAGQPLVSIQRGLGLKRGSPSFRRLTGLAQLVIDPGDPVNYAPHYDKPFDFSYDPTVSPGTNVLVIPTGGDMNVPVNTGIMMARAAGLIELEKANPRFDGTKYAGMSDNRVLLSTHTVESIECLPRWRNAKGEAVLFDIDDLDFGKNPYGEPSMSTEANVTPLRLKKAATHAKGGVHGMRIPMIEQNGKHDFNAPTPDWPFDINGFMNNQVYWYFYTDGNELVDDPCLEKSTCTVEKNGFALPFPQADWEKKKPEDW